MLYFVLICLQAALIIRVLLRPHRDPASRMAWIVVILVLPVIGLFAYLLFGKTQIGPGRAERMRRALAKLPAVDIANGYESAKPKQTVPNQAFPLFRVGQSISGYEPVTGNETKLLPDSNATIDAMVVDIDAAKDHVHLLFYIWLPDNNGTKVAKAVQRAAKRGVDCRILVDDLGSRSLIGSPLWSAMKQAGANAKRALRIGRPILRALKGRIDLRDHRKIVVIDNWITYCGSQNCADPEFRIKAKYAPWVDAVVRFEGPVARQNQHVFLTDWMTACDEDLGALLREPVKPTEQRVPAQVISSGPIRRPTAVPEMFASLIYAAESHLVITTPYYVPNDTLQSALCAAANRGVDTRLLVPAQNDDWAVAASSRSYYRELLGSGVRIFEFDHGLLHAKTLTMDDNICLIGSANMDRRSFELNFENNVLVADQNLTRNIWQRQKHYMTLSQEVTLDEVLTWSYRRVLWQNAVAIMSPLL